MHLKRYPQGFIEIFYHGRELIHHNVGFSIILNGSSTTVDVIQVFSGVYNRAGLYVFTVVIDEDVLHDRQQPRFKVGSRNELIHITNSPESSFLVQVFGFLAVFSQLVSKGVKGSTET